MTHLRIMRVVGVRESVEYKAPHVICVLGNNKFNLSTITLSLLHAA